MADDPDLVKREDESYRRGVVLGLTMAEVTILLLFCLLLTMLFLLHRKDQQIAALGGSKSGRTYVVSLPVLQQIQSQFGPVDSQTEINDDFQKLIIAQQRLSTIDQIANTGGVALDPHQPVDAHVKVVAKIANAARNVVVASGQPARAPDDVLKGMDSIEKATAILMKARGANAGVSITDRTAIRTAIAGELCADQHSDQKRFDECKKKIIDVTGGKGLEFQSCWWDKTVNPWQTKDIYNVVLTDSGLIIHDLDPAIEEYRNQKATILPVSGIRLGRLVSQSEFLDETLPLLAWSDKNKCRFYVRVFDQTGPSAKAIYKDRLQAVDERFYKEMTQRTLETETGLGANH